MNKKLKMINENKKDRKRYWIWIIAIVVVIIFAIVLIVMRGTYKSLDASTISLLEALEQNDYKGAEEAVNLGADVNFIIAGRPILHNYVQEDEFADVDFLIKHGVDVNSQTKYGRAPLHEAALYGCYDIAKLLIEAGANVNARNSREETPLFYAEEGLITGPPHTSMNDKVAELLRSYGATR